MAKRAPITSPYAPDADALRAWLEEMVASMKLVELIAAIVSLVTRMQCQIVERLGVRMAWWAVID